MSKELKERARECIEKERNYLREEHPLGCSCGRHHILEAHDFLITRVQAEARFHEGQEWADNADDNNEWMRKRLIALYQATHPAPSQKDYSRNRLLNEQPISDALGSNSCEHCGKEICSHVVARLVAAMCQKCNAFPCECEPEFRKLQPAPPSLSVEQVRLLLEKYFRESGIHAEISYMCLCELVTGLNALKFAPASAGKNGVIIPPMPPEVKEPKRRKMWKS